MFATGFFENSFRFSDFLLSFKNFFFSLKLSLRLKTVKCSINNYNLKHTVNIHLMEYLKKI